MGREKGVGAAPASTIKSKEAPLTVRVHSSTKAIPCKGLDCEVRFIPKRKDQVFCSALCREHFFRVARSLGVILLERGRYSPELNTIVTDLLEEGGERTGQAEGKGS